MIIMIIIFIRITTSILGGMVKSGEVTMSTIDCVLVGPFMCEDNSPNRTLVIITFS